ncbi:hypothetical protein [Streptomyces acidiscabies]|uniref:hypothetical protein n=1 Tax=Streptomyces acidiscabies TaxID=42234 RepID=UPI0009528D7D|nr:hypothetical protein [Streptomyces acidiscabies]
MRRITGRAVRTALAALAVTTMVALPLAVAGHQGSASQGRQVVAAGDPLDDLRYPPGGDGKGSWVWDDQE